MSAEALLVQLLPELILLLGACATLLAGAMWSSRLSSTVQGLCLLTLVGALIAASWLGIPADGSAKVGLWFTSLTYYVRMVTLGMGVLILLVNWHEPVLQERGEYLAMILFSLLGVLLTASANDLVVLFLSIELVSVPTYVLIGLSRMDAKASEAAVKYFFLGALSAAILAYGLSFVYGAAGTTTLYTFKGGMANSVLPVDGVWSGTLLVGILLVIAGLAFKLAAVPFHVYAPDVYEGAASPVTGLLGFVPKFGGFVALVKLLAACHWQLPDGVMWILWALAVVTMTVGNVLALLQTNVKRILAYSSIAHTGYMLIAVLVGPSVGSGPMGNGMVALMFYIAVYGAMNLGVFALLTTFRVGHRDAETLNDLAGLAGRAPLACLAFVVCVFSLMGMPPTAGFLGKLYILGGAFSLPESHAFRYPLVALAIIGVLNAAVGAAYYLRIVATTYFGTVTEDARIRGGAPVRWGLGLCAVPMLFLFVRPMTLLGPARTATLTLQQCQPDGELVEVFPQMDKPSRLMSTTDVLLTTEHRALATTEYSEHPITIPSSQISSSSQD